MAPHACLNLLRACVRARVHSCWPYLPVNDALITRQRVAFCYLTRSHAAAQDRPPPPSSALQGRPLPQPLLVLFSPIRQLSRNVLKMILPDDYLQEFDLNGLRDKNDNHPASCWHFRTSSLADIFSCFRIAGKKCDWRGNDFVTNRQSRVSLDFFFFFWRKAMICNYISKIPPREQNIIKKQFGTLRVSKWISSVQPSKPRC